MKKTSLITILVVFLVSFTLLISPAYAGNVQRYRWEGLAIGLGAAILGSALFSHHHQSAMAYDYPAPPHRPGPSWQHCSMHRPHKEKGHWEIRKEWVPPTYEKVWNPGHYNRHGEWVSGRWINIEDEPGYWEETRVWVAGRSCY